MNLLNDQYDKNCKPKCEIFKEVSNDISIIEDFFENFDDAREFFLNRDKWKCIPYQGHAKPGYESVFPKWVGKSLVEKFTNIKKMKVIEGSHDISCNYRDENPEDYVWSISSSNYFPHVDGINEFILNNHLHYICLINLNKTPISTNFYTFKNQVCCDEKTHIEWKRCIYKTTSALIKHYKKESINMKELEKFLQEFYIKDLQLVKTIKYNPNQAIFYPGNLFHSSNISKDYNEQNPRATLRISFSVDLSKKSKNVNEFSKISYK